MMINVQLLFLFLLCCCPTLKAGSQVTRIEESNHSYLNKNDTISCHNGPIDAINTFSGNFKRGSYDSTSYSIKVDSEGALTLSELRQSQGKHQNELSLLLCKGTVTRRKDTVCIQAKTIYNKFYLFSIAKNSIVDSCHSDVQIRLVSQTLKRRYCPTLVRTGSSMELIALPQQEPYSELYKPIHPSKTVGIFTYFSVADSTGKFTLYPAGDYILIGGNHLSIDQ
jgi:hypothetical protein